MVAAALFLVLFTTISGIILNLMGYASFPVWTPVIFGITQGLLITAIALSGGQTIEILGSSINLKGPAMALFFGSIIAYIALLSIPADIGFWVYGVIIGPSLLAFGLEFLEVSKQ